MQGMTSKLFVALPSELTNGLVIFGMNSFQPNGEVQEVVYFPASDDTAGSSVKVRIEKPALAFIMTIVCVNWGSNQPWLSS